MWAVGDDTTIALPEVGVIKIWQSVELKGSSAHDKSRVQHVPSLTGNELRHNQSAYEQALLYLPVCCV